MQFAEVGRPDQIVRDFQAVRRASRLELALHAVGLMFFVRHDVQRDGGFGIGQLERLLDVPHSLLDRGGILEQIPVQPRLVHESPQDAAFALPLAESAEERLEGDHLLEDRQEAPPGHVTLGAFRVDLHALDREIRQVVVQRRLVLEVALGLALLDLEERRLCDVDVAALDQLVHLTVQKREQEGADVAAVDVGVGHENDLVVAGFGNVEGLAIALLAVLLPLPPDAGAQRHDERADFIAGEHLVEPRPLDVENLALEGQDGLELPIPSLLGRPAGRIALHDEELAERRVLFRAVRQLAGQGPPVQRALAPDELFRLARRLARPGRVDRLADDLARDRRILLEVGAEVIVDRRLDDALHFAVTELRLGLPLELGVAHLDADDRREAFAHVVASERLGFFLEQIVRVGVVVDGPRQRGLKAHQMGAPLLRVDVVGEGEEVFGVAVVVLERDLQNHVRLFDGDVDRLVQRRLGFVEMVDEGDDAALVQEHLLLRGLAPLVFQRDRETLVQEGEFPEALRQHVETELGDFENLPVRLETDFRAPPLGDARGLQRRRGFAPLIALLEDLAVLPDLQLEPFGEGVDDGDADAVQAAGHGVRPLFELAARVQDRQRDFRRRLLLRRVHAGGNAAPVVDDRDAAVDVERDLDGLAEAGHVLVHAVVHDLVDEMMQAVRARAADVHGGTLADRIEPLQHFDLVGTVAVRLSAARPLIVRRHSVPVPTRALASRPSPTP